MKLSLAGSIGLALLGWLLYQPALTHIGRILVYRSPDFERADAVMVLPGSVPDRVLEAVDLLHESRAAVVLLGRDRAGTEQRMLQRLGIHRMQDYEVNQEILLKLGVAPQNVKLLPAASRSTREDALSLRDYLEETGIESVAIVTCKYHSYRAYLNFEALLRDSGVTVYAVPSRHCGFDPGNWWHDRDQLKIVYVEWGKLISYWLGFS